MSLKPLLVYAYALLLTNLALACILIVWGQRTLVAVAVQLIANVVGMLFMSAVDDYLYGR